MSFGSKIHILLYSIKCGDMNDVRALTYSGWSGPNQHHKLVYAKGAIIYICIILMSDSPHIINIYCSVWGLCGDGLCL